MSKLLTQLEHKLKTKHYAPSTTTLYVHWCKAYILFHGGKTHPIDMAEPHVEQFLSHLAIKQHVAPSTQNQALQAILFMYKHLLGIQLQNIQAIRAKKAQRLPTVLSKAEVKTVIDHIRNDTYRLIIQLIYGGGLRLKEALRLRVMNLDFDRQVLQVIDSKHGGSRQTLFPTALHEPVRAHLVFVKQQHQRDLADGYGAVWLPHALARKYPKAATDWKWQYVFPSPQLSTDPADGKTRRHHLFESGIRRALTTAVGKAGLHKRVSPHTFRHSFATHLVESGVSVEDVQKLLGHKNRETTLIYLHLASPEKRIRSPLEDL